MFFSPDWLSFQRFIHRWYVLHGRHQLPWRQTYDPYHVLVSETMLQQTQVERVIPKYLAFLKSFPSLGSLAEAKTSQVITHWQGLGYNRRGLNLHKAAQTMMDVHQGTIPQATEALMAIPGIGPYTASAIQAFAYNLPSIVIETNIRTVYIYHFFPKQVKVSDNELIPLIQTSLDTTQPRLWYSALMDYGATLKKVVPNPSQKSKSYAKQSKFHGSLRQVRGQIIKALTLKDSLSHTQLQNTIAGDTSKLDQALAQLEKESFIYNTGGHYHLKD